MFRSIFGDLNVKMPDEAPGTRWQRLRKLAMLSVEDTGMRTEQVRRLEQNIGEGRRKISLIAALSYATLLAERLKCSPLDILVYVYPELNNPAVKRQQGRQ